ncbi:MAG: S-layer homology domain-containing protein [Peptoniphilus sp.]|nr:S-layer homology domain-containing protein [Peptoniphilus sp.]
MKRILLLTMIAFFLFSTKVTSSSYKDVGDHWAEEYINYIDEKNFIDGFEDNTFRPDETLKKSQIYKIINRLFYFTEKSDTYFKYIDEKDWFLEELQIAIKAGYVDEDVYFTDAPIERIEFINIIGYLYGLEDKSNTHKYFTDIENLHSNSKEYVGALLSDGLLEGFSDFKLQPESNLSRAQAAKIIALCEQKYGRTPNISKAPKEPPQDDNDEVRQLMEKLLQSVRETNNMNLWSFTDESTAELKRALMRANDLLLRSDNVPKDEIIRALEDIERAKGQLVHKPENPRLYVDVVDERGNPVNAQLYINNEVFKSGDTLKRGRYLLKVVAADGNTQSTYVNMEEEDKRVEVVLKYKHNEKLILSLGKHLHSDKREYSMDERVKIRVMTPSGYELKNLLVNGKVKKLLSDEYIFIIKEDTHIEAVFVPLSL